MIYKKHKELISLSIALGLYVAILQISGIHCPIKYLFGISCPGCGISRAALSLLLLDPSAAASFNPGIFLLVPGAAVALILWLKGWGKGFKATLFILALGLIAVYVVRVALGGDEVVVFDPGNGAIYKFFKGVFEK